jgi:hypothetical protein
MPKLSNILADSDEVAIPTPDGDITIEYYPSKLTQKLMSQMQQYEAQARKAEEDTVKQKEILGKVYGLLLSFFKSWDLEDEVACGKCEACKYRLAREGLDEKEQRSEEERTHFDNEEKDLIECTAKRLITLPLNAETLDSLPYWLLAEITRTFIRPNSPAPKRKRKS